jgi:hypothetical protein
MKKLSKVRQKLNFLLFTCIFLASGCSTSHEPKVHNETQRSPDPVQLKKAEAVRVVERYFQALSDDRKDIAKALLEYPVYNAPPSDSPEGENGKFHEVQAEHFDWFSYFKESRFVFERAAVIESDQESYIVRAFCVVPIGDGETIPQIVDAEIVVRSGKMVIRELTPKTREAIQLLKKTRSA